MRKRRTRQTFEAIEIIDAGAKGKSVAKAPDGRIVFVRNAVPGDVVDVVTTKKRKAYYEGEVTHYHTLSEKRVEPLCEHFGTCGGCKWQNMDYGHQLKFKQKEITENFARIGQLKFSEPLPIIGSANKYYYRNKLEFSFTDNRWLSREEINNPEVILDRNALGFHIPGMWDKILDIRNCYLQKSPSNEIRLEIKRFALDNDIPFYSPRLRSGFLRTLMIRTSSTGNVMVLLQFFEDRPELREKILYHIEKKFPEITSLLYVINNKLNDSIYDLEVHCHSGKDYIIEEMENLIFRIGPKSFYQTNSQQAYELYKVVRDFADLKGTELVFDLYTGTGTIALFLAKWAEKVIGVEAVPEAIESARINAQINNATNVKFMLGDMKDIFDDEMVRLSGKPDVIITDPPRDGMHKKVIEQLLKIGSDRIVYVSCNSATQARDLALMKEVYEIKKVQPVDMFPQTHHVENVVLLEKRLR